MALRGKCRRLQSELLCIDISRAWILAKAGARFKWCNGCDLCFKLGHLDDVLNVVYENAENSPWESSPDRRRSDVILGHLQHCKEVMNSLGEFYPPPSLFDLSVVAIRRSLGLYPGRKLRSMDVTLPQVLQDAVLLKDLWPFVEKVENCFCLYWDDLSSSDILSTDSEDDLSFSDDLEMISSGDE